MTISVKSLNSEGINRFGAWLDDPTGKPPIEILADVRYVEELEGQFFVDTSATFETTYELGRYLNGVFASVEDVHLLRANKGMWSWLSLAMINSLLGRERKNAGLPLARAHYIDENPRWSYRLITRTAWDLVRLHGEDARIAISSKKSPWGEMAEQMTSRQEVYVHPSVWPVARALYTSSAGAPKSGSTTQRSKKARRDPKNLSGLGGVRRLPKTFKQFDRTYALREMKSDEIVDLLPGEYAKWRSK